MKLILASGNTHKLEEISQIMKRERISVDKLPSFLLKEPSPVEDGDSFFANACIKASYYAKKLPGKYVLSDDSGLCVPALNNQPGIFSSRYAGDNASDKDNLKKLLLDMSAVEKRDAFFQCAMVIYKDGQLIAKAEGKAKGVILRDERGLNGFGYDPVFLSESFGKTFSELSAAEKNLVSHRNQALLNLIKEIKS